MNKQTINVLYPREQLQSCTMVLRLSLDKWTTDLEPTSVSGDLHTFEVETREPYFHFKPCLRTENRSVLWSQGGNYLAPVVQERSIYPYFRAPHRGEISSLEVLQSKNQGHQYRYRVYLPPGYDENTLTEYPVCYMHDGHNLFFPQEAFAGQTWKVDRTLEVLDKMNSIESCIVVGIYPRERFEDYTLPGAEEYAKTLRHKLLPLIERRYRTLKGPDHRVVMGSSLGGLVSFYLAWNHNDIFGRAACLSSTFGYDKKLFRSVSRSKRKRCLRVYLDSGWPGDNFAVTQAMAHLLIKKGYGLGRDLHYVAVPEARHSEDAWANRLHLPFQFLLGLAYGNDPVVDSPILTDNVA